MALRRFKFSLLLALCSFGLASGQSVSIPDSNFLKAIKSLPNSKLIVDNKLVINEAAKVKGTLIFSDQHIRNAEGVQYFTSVSTIDLSGNQLDSLPKTMHSDTLKYLYLGKNSLQKMPDLFLCPNLIFLDVVENDLGSLAGLDKLKKLQTVLAMGNKITVLPPLDSLKSLTALDVSYNQLKAYPILPSSHKVLALHLNNNHITSLPNNITVPPSGRVFLYSNDLTFSDLLKLRSVPGYDSLVNYRWQNSIPMEDYTVAEGDTLVMETLVDKGIGGMRYRWFKNDALIQDNPTDGYSIPSVKSLDGGKYVVQLINDQFPNVSLVTDTFALHVRPCLEASQFTMVGSPITCKKSGALQITTTSKESLDYYLKGKATGIEHHSTNGIFKGLTEPVYTLKITSKKGCQMEYPTEIKFDKEECQKALITPNGDGEADTFFFHKSGTVTIHDKNGTVVKTLSTPNDWDGSAKGGRVPPGLYLADVNNGEELINISVVY